VLPFTVGIRDGVVHLLSTWVAPSDGEVGDGQVCGDGADRGGSWRDVPALLAEAAPFTTHTGHNSNGCPQCLTVDRRTVPHTCEASEHAATRLVDGR
jgi:hypothetical protein